VRRDCDTLNSTRPLALQARSAVTPHLGSMFNNSRALLEEAYGGIESQKS